MSKRTAPAADAREAIAARGRAVGDLVAKGDAAALFARFTPEMARAVSEAALKAVLDDTVAAARIGERIGESVLASRPEGDVYAAERRWQEGRNLTLTVVFAPGTGRISGLLLRPAKKLPPDPHRDYALKTRLSLPFAPGDEWFVFWGGPTEAQNYHVIAPDQRHAYDFTSLQNGKSHTGDGTRNEQYHVWGRRIVAPAAATVVTVVDGIHDNRPQVEMNRKAIAGNHVVLDFGSGEWAMLGHLKKGSIRVKPGQKVTAGQVLGLCGNSGNSSEPHLHFHVQDRAALFGKARGLPVVFNAYLADNKGVAKGTPVQGQQLKAR